MSTSGGTRKPVPRVVVNLAGKSDTDSMETLNGILRAHPEAIWGRYKGQTPFDKAIQCKMGPAVAICTEAVAKLNQKCWLRYVSQLSRKAVVEASEFVQLPCETSQMRQVTTQKKRKRKCKATN